MRDDALLIKIIYESIKRIENNALKGEENFFSDVTTQDAILRNFQVIGDAIKDLSDDYRKVHSAIPWNVYTKFRDKLTHGYLGVSLVRVWEFMHKELPALKARITEILD